MTKIFDRVDTWKLKLDTLNGVHTSSIKTFQNIDVSTINSITKVASLITAYSRLHNTGAHILVDLDSLMEEAYANKLYNIKGGVDPKSNVTLNASETTHIIKADDAYMKYKKAHDHLVVDLKLLELMTKTVSDFSFHFKTKLDWLKFLEGG